MNYCLKYYNKKYILLNNIRNIQQIDYYKILILIKIFNILILSVYKKDLFNKCKNKWEYHKLNNYYRILKMYRKVLIIQKN